jgi:peptide/nickel transport system substrate-binding protein
MKLRLYAVLLCVLFGGCDFLAYPAYIIEPSPPPSPPPIILPAPAPRAVTFGVAFSPADSFHPLTDTKRHNDHAARLCYEGLFEPDERFVPRPLLAVSMQTENNVHFTFNLRENVLFHDGTPLTAGDVVYSINEARKPGTPYAARLSCVAGVYAQDGGSVAVTMNTAVWNAASLFEFPIVKESGGAVPYGTGPYQMVLEPGGGYLRPSEYWRGETPSPARIELVEITSPDTLVNSFQYGYIAMMPLDMRDTFSPGIHTGYDKVTVPSAMMQYIGFNTKKRPFDRKDFRRSVSLAVDRRGAVSHVFGEDATAAVLPVPPSSPFYSQDAARDYRYDIGEASRLRENYRNLQELDFIVNAENASRVEMAEYIAVTLRYAGFAVNVRPLRRAAFEAALASGNYGLYYAEARLAPNLDPREFLLPSGAFARGASESYALRSALNAMAASDPYSEGGAEALEAVWAAFYDETPIITLCFRDTLFISQRGLLSGQTPAFFNPFRGFAGWEIADGGQ